MFRLLLVAFGGYWVYGGIDLLATPDCPFVSVSGGSRIIYFTCYDGQPAFYSGLLMSQGLASAGQILLGLALITFALWPMLARYRQVGRPSDRTSHPSVPNFTPYEPSKPELSIGAIECTQCGKMNYGPYETCLNCRTELPIDRADYRTLVSHKMAQSPPLPVCGDGPEGCQGQVLERRPDLFRCATHFAVRAPGMPRPSGQNSADRIAQLGRLGDLRDRGVLTNEEFEVEKRKLLDS